jgi:hypothetical protein
MKITATPDISNVETLDDVTRYTTQCLTQIVSVLNNNISFSDNFKATIASVTFPTANSEQAVDHGLGKVPTGYILAGASAATSIYNGTTANTDSKIYLKSSVATSVTLIIF